MQKKAFALVLLTCLLASSLLLAVPNVKASNPSPVPSGATKVWGDTFENGLAQWSSVQGNWALEHVSTDTHVSGSQSMAFDSITGETTVPEIQSTTWGVVTPNHDVWFDFYINASSASSFMVDLPTGTTVGDGYPTGIQLSYSLDNGGWTLTYPSPSSQQDTGFFGVSMTSNIWNRITLHVIPSPDSNLAAGEVFAYFNGVSICNGTRGAFTALAGAISMFNFGQDGGSTYFDDMDVYTNITPVSTLTLITNLDVSMTSGTGTYYQEMSSGTYSAPQGEIITLAKMNGVPSWVIDGGSAQTGDILVLTMNTDHTATVTFSTNALTQAGSGTWMQEGFEGGSFPPNSDWFTDAHPTISSNAHTGTHSLSVDGNNDAYWDNVNNSLPTGYVETNYQNLWFNFSVKTDDTVSFLCQLDGYNGGNGGYTPTLQIGYGNSNDGFVTGGNLGITVPYFDGTDNLNSVAIYTDISALPTSWTTFNIDLNDYTQSNATVTMYQNGTKIIDHVAATGPMAIDNSGFNEIGLWPSSPVLFDDFSLSTQPNSFVQTSPTPTPSDSGLPAHDGGNGGDTNKFTGDPTPTAPGWSPSMPKLPGFKLSNMEILGIVVFCSVAAIASLMYLSSRKSRKR
jgi:hypothetical protein